MIGSDGSNMKTLQIIDDIYLSKFQEKKEKVNYPAQAQGNLQVSGSSYNLPAHGSGGARARKINSAAKSSVRPSEGRAGAECG